MQIQRGKLYENKTWKYLYPCLKYYGGELTEKLSQFFKLAVGVKDYNRKENHNCIYVLLDVNIPLLKDSQIKNYQERFSKFLDWIRYKDYYVTDYIYEEDMHMVVVKLPIKYNSTYINFIKGNYSSMYNLADKRDYFKFVTSSNKELEIKQNNKIRKIRGVLERDKSFLKPFVTEVNSKFKTTATVEDFKDAELDYPPNKKEEIFNYEEKGAYAP